MTQVVARWVIVPAFAFTTWQFLAPPSSDPGLPIDDKVLHGLVFAALTGVLLAAGLGARWCLVGLAVYGIGVEVAQGVMPYDRRPEVLDVVADLIGVAAVVGLRSVIARRV